ncbi:2'-5' RNA ligase family protein [Streptomyces litchfieldiae]|uniref:2'-5' RNA ligase family protein n=1 Tax=Streptomyces litchfieldiae TaxID=3075543 RepID=A0ABU2N3A1_9ACTN|nr:2'-5' RNA ligase family protein [Streptomyces sp. DSM 44938]MDT0347528.1 2'-5' RNA ligase family protein [Streptomyces sp. DSM 44938]
MDDFFARVTGRAWPWPAGREDYHWHILPPDSGLVRDKLMGPYREVTHHPGLEPVAPEWAHITVLHSGPVGEVTGPEITAITSRVRAACATVAPFTLTVDRPAVGTVAVELPARPGAPARRLWELTTEATREVIGGRYPVLPAVYYPHLTIAYADHRELHQTGANALVARSWDSGFGLRGAYTLAA